MRLNDKNHYRVGAIRIILEPVVKIGQILERRNNSYCTIKNIFWNKSYRSIPKASFTIRASLFTTLILSQFMATILPLTSHAQSTQNTNTTPANNTPYVGWLSQYPVIKQHKHKAKLWHYLVEKVIGKTTQYSVGRPIYVLAEDPVRMMILDQSKSTIFVVGNKKIAIPKALRRKEDYYTSMVYACKNAENEILFTDSRLNKIFVLSANGKKLWSLNDSLKLEQPTGIAYNTVNHEIWVVETNGHHISILDDSGRLKKVVGSRGEDTAQFNFPTSICTDKNGDMYVVDAMNFRVEIFNKEGIFLNTFGKEGDVSGSFARPKGIATDSYGNIYVADGLFHVVQIFDRQGNYLYKFGQQGRGKEDFWMPSGVSIDGKNNIYVADSYNSRVQIFHLYNGIENEKNNRN